MFNLKVTVCLVCQSCATVSGLNQDGSTHIKDEFRKQMEQLAGASLDAYMR